MGSKRNKKSSGNVEKYIHYPHFTFKEDPSTLGPQTAADVPVEIKKKKKKRDKETDQKESALDRYYRNRKAVPEDITVFQGYSLKVLTSNWFYPKSSYPKDYDAYSPAGGNNFRSSYNRWGSSEGRMISETHAAQESFWREYKKLPPKQHNPMINVFTLRNLDFKNFEGLLPSQPADSEVSATQKRSKSPDRFSSTMQRDFVNPFPTEPKMLDRAQLYKPETKYRNLLTEIAHPRRRGFNKFYDENLEYLNAKKVTALTPPPWSLHYNLDGGSITEKSLKKDAPVKDISKETCAKCS